MVASSRGVVSRDVPDTKLWFQVTARPPDKKEAPWASLIIAGIEDVEDRTWRTKYRGPLGIHAGSQVDQDALDAISDLLPDDLPLA